MNGVVVLLTGKEDTVTAFQGDRIPAISDLRGSVIEFSCADIIVYEDHVIKSNLWKVIK